MDYREKELYLLQQIHASQVDPTWENTKDKPFSTIGNGLKVVNNTLLLTGRIIKSVAGGTVEMEAGKYYDITLTNDNALTLTIKPIDDTTYAYDYEGSFDTDDKATPKGTWPEGVNWLHMPVMRVAMHYEFSIRVVNGKKYGIVCAWVKA